MPKITKAGAPRKSRRKRLNISGGTGAAEKFNPLSSDWNRIEVAYGYELIDDDRKKIIDLINMYFLFQPSEASAPFVDDAIRYLNTLEKTAKRFRQVMLEREQIPTLVGEARLRGEAIRFVQNHVGRYLAEFEFRRKTDWMGLLDVMGACTVAFVKTREYISGDAASRGFAEGSAWNNLVWRSSKFAEQRQLPSRIAKSDDPGRTSPFVRFVWELQNSFPSHFRRHQFSFAGLAQAIAVARRQTNRAIARREAEKANSPEQPN